MFVDKEVSSLSASDCKKGKREGPRWPVSISLWLWLCAEVCGVKVLVTGGAGFIGSHLAEALVRAGHRVRVIDNFLSGRPENLKSVADSVEVHRGDCADLAAAHRAAKGMEVVFHEAAVPSVARSVDDPWQSHHANATATLAMLLAARDAGVRRFIYAGGKLTGEYYLRNFAELYGLETVTLRYFNVFGPRQDPGSPYSGVISLFITALLDGRRPVIYGDGLQTRDFTYVGNVVDGNLRALTSAAAGRGEVINVATGRRVTLRRLLRAIAREVG